MSADLSGILLATASLGVAIVVPGWLVLRCVQWRLPVTLQLSLAASIGLGILAIWGFVLSQADFLSGAGLWVAVLVTVVCLGALRLWQSGRPHWGLAVSRIPVGESVPIAIAAASIGLWFKFVDIHSGDIGTHVYLAESIVLTHHLPVFQQLLPQNQPSVFTYGTALTLAAGPMLSDQPISQTFSGPLFLFYVLILLNVANVTYLALRSWRWTIPSCLIYAFASIPAARIYLGNLDDLLGYFLLGSLVTTVALFLASRSREQRRHVILVGVFQFSTITFFYPYAFIDSVLFSLVVFLFFVTRDTLVSLTAVLRDLVRRKDRLVTGIAFAASAIVLSQATYLTQFGTRNVSIISRTEWPPLTFAGIVANVGNFWAIILAVCAVLVMLWKPTIVSRTVTAWAVALLIASQLPLLHIGVEPVRFVWHMIEPISVLAAILLGWSYEWFVRTPSLEMRTTSLSIRWRTPGRSERRLLGIAAVTIIMLLVLSPPLIQSIEEQPLSEPYYSQDIAIATWLKDNYKGPGLVVADSNIDPTVTWIQEGSGLPDVAYASSFAADVAAPPWREEYQGFTELYASPESPGVEEITRTYNVAYVVGVGQDFDALSNSLFFAQVFNLTGSGLFVPLYPSAYGSATSPGGYVVQLSSGGTAALVDALTIDVNSTRPQSLTLPIFGQVTRPYLATALVQLTVNGRNLGYIQTSNISSGVSNLGMTRLFPGIQSNDISLPLNITIPLDRGFNQVSLSLVAGTQVELTYLSLRQDEIAYQVENENLVPP